MVMRIVGSWPVYSQLEVSLAEVVVLEKSLVSGLILLVLMNTLVEGYLLCLSFAFPLGAEGE